MNQDIGILALDHLVYTNQENGILEGLRKYLPPGVEVLDQTTSGFKLLDFIENHKRLIILDKDTSSYSRRTLYGEVEYWGYFTGGMLEDIVVLSMNSPEESLTHVLECLNRWNN